MAKTNKPQFRYAVFYAEWVSANDPLYPLQRALRNRSESFKTKTEAIEFYNMFKNDKSIRDWSIYDIVTNKKIELSSIFPRNSKPSFIQNQKLI